MEILAKERQYRIQQMLKQDGAVSTSDLVEQFQVSLETVRRDFLAMEQAGILTRVHGGAVMVGGMLPYNDLAKRNEEHSSGKRELAALACGFINEGDYIIIDNGSTALFLAEAVKERFHRLTVVTGSLDVFEILRGSKEIELILCGGHFKEKENCFYGSLVLDTLSRLHVQKAFICPTAVSLEYGICDYEKDLYQIQKKFMEISDQVYILADSSKFEKRALLKLSDMNPEYWYVTDSNLSKELKHIYLENQMKLYNGGNEE